MGLTENMGSIDIKLLLAEEIQLPLAEMEPVIKQAINLYNSNNKSAICSVQLTQRPTKQTHLHLNEAACKWLHF